MTAPSVISPAHAGATFDVLVVGGGPAGLAAALEARRLGCGKVLVVDRETEMGGIPRHADHTGFGMRDMHRLLSGPAYARRYAELADRAGVTLRASTTVTAHSAPDRVTMTGTGGIDEIAARAIILATGCRERPRAARLVPGDRCSGILTAGSLQQLVYLQHQRVGQRAVIVGAEHVSFSAILTLVHGGARVLAMVTEHPRDQTYPPYKWLSATRHRVPVLTRHRITRISGQPRLSTIEIEDLRTGARRTIECDTLVFTGDWIPDHELARRWHLAMDARRFAPRVDGALRTSARGVFAAGNLIHAAETADVAALSGRHAARAAVAFLADGRWPERSLPIVCEDPIEWISPNAVAADQPEPARQRFTWRIAEVRTRATLRIEQGDRLLLAQRYRSLVPTLPLSLQADWMRSVDLDGGPVTVRMEVGQS